MARGRLRFWKMGHSRPSTHLLLSICTPYLYVGKVSRYSSPQKRQAGRRVGIRAFPHPPPTLLQPYRHASASSHSHGRWGDWEYGTRPVWHYIHVHVLRTRCSCPPDGCLASLACLFRLFAFPSREASSLPALTRLPSHVTRLPPADTLGR